MGTIHILDGGTPYFFQKSDQKQTKLTDYHQLRPFNSWTDEKFLKFFKNFPDFPNTFSFKKKFPQKLFWTPIFKKSGAKLTKIDKKLTKIYRV